MNEYVIAKYIRLSIEDGVTESMSIPSQHKLLDQHIEELDIPNATVLEFVDNGYTGTMIERPAIQEMLELAQCGRINCIIIKDFSRFSRNVTDSSYLIDRIFPLYQIRFISVSDGFDSNDYKGDTGGIDVAFKYVLNEHYSVDLSKKVSSVKRLKMEQGTNIVANAIYGYRKNDMGKWEPEPDAADVVRQVFKMALEGFATAQIRDKMCESRYPTPLEYIEMKRGKDIAPECMWTARMVLHILSNEQYTGSYVSGKQKSKAVGSHSKIHLDKSEWIIFPYSHPPIVSKEDFAKVQEIRKNLKGSTTAKPLKSDMSRPKRLRMLSGDHIAATPIYGYMKMKNGKWKIDETAGNVVREIFEMALKGASFDEISGKLSENEHPNPSEYIKLNRGHKITATNRWTVKSVQSILKNEQYAGSYVSGKILKDYESGKSYHAPKSEWIVIPDNHPAIVSQEIFDEVQAITARSRTRRKNVRPKDYLLRGKIACGCCGYALAYDGSRDSKFYRCHHTYADPNAKCHKMTVSAPELEEAVLTIIRQKAELVLNNEGISSVTSSRGFKKDFDEYKALIHQNEEQMVSFYEQYIRGKIKRDDYLDLKNECSKKTEALKSKLSVLRKLERDKKTNRKSMDYAKVALGESAVSQEIVDILIDKIFVFPDFEIEVYWKIADFSIVE